EVNTAPALTLPGTQTIAEQTALSVNATATDSDLPANTLTFALVSGPTGLTVSSGGAMAGRAHVGTPVTIRTRTPAAVCKEQPRPHRARLRHRPTQHDRDPYTTLFRSRSEHRAGADPAGHSDHRRTNGPERERNGDRFGPARQHADLCAGVWPNRSDRLLGWR